MADPKIKYDIEAAVTGQEDAAQLADKLRELGDALGGDLQANAKEAAQALDMLSKRQELLQSFAAIKTESQQAAQALEAARAESTRLAQAMPGAAASTQQLKEAQRAAAVELRSAKAQLDAQQVALQKLREETQGAARRNDEYRASVTTLRAGIQSARAAVKEKADALNNAKTAAADAARAEVDLGKAFDQAKESSRAAKVEMLAKTKATQDARAALQAVGISTADLAQKEIALKAAVAQARQEVQQLVPAYSQVAQAAKESQKQQESTSKSLREGMTSISSQLQSIQNIATVALGGGFAGGLLRDVAATADAFDNLRAKIKLSTGEGAAFEQGFVRVQQVAVATSSSLESTGTLFARILQAGKEFNLTQEAALGLTQSINQAVQLSGSSAQAADAAVTQLIQGLQSGVLRGEEFNSMMEQAPRVAQALANGLGVTTGELRKMAGEGQLTTQVVTNALKSQSAVLQEEFGKLPATVGRSITNLQTQWSIFIGGLNDSTGATSYVAAGINALAGNLDTLARVAMLAGAALTASMAVQAAGALRAYAAQAALAAGATNLLSASIEKIPKTVNIVLAVTGLEVGWQIGTMLQENFALARQLGVGMVGYFNTVVNGLQLAKDAAAAVFTSDTVDAAYQRFQERQEQIRNITADMMRDAEQAPPKVAAAADQAGAAAQGMGSAAAAAGQQMAQAGQAGAAGMAQAGKATQDAQS